MFSLILCGAIISLIINPSLSYDNKTMGSNLMVDRFSNVTVSRKLDRDVYSTQSCSKCDCGEYKFLIVDLKLESGCFNETDINERFRNRLVYFDNTTSVVFLMENATLPNSHLLFPYSPPTQCYISDVFEGRYNNWVYDPMTYANLYLTEGANLNSYKIEGTINQYGNYSGMLIRIDIMCENQQIYYLLLRFKGEKTYIFDPLVSSSSTPPILTETPLPTTPSTLPPTPSPTPPPTLPPTSPQNNNSALTDSTLIGISVGASLGAVVIIVLLLLIVYIRRGKRRRRDKMHLPNVSYNEYYKGARNLYVIGEPGKDFPERERPNISKAGQKTPLKHDPLPPIPRSPRPMTGPLSVEEKQDYVCPSNNHMPLNTVNAGYELGNTYESLENVRDSNYEPLHSQDNYQPLGVDNNKDDFYLDLNK